MPAWNLITNHGAVLILLAQHGRITVRELAHRLGLTERLIHRIIAESPPRGTSLSNAWGTAISIRCTPTGRCCGRCFAT
jgi:hypothetical protein